jgi:hypothetical protein
MMRGCSRRIDALRPLMAIIALLSSRRDCSPVFFVAVESRALTPLSRGQRRECGRKSSATEPGSRFEPTCFLAERSFFRGMLAGCPGGSPAVRPPPAASALTPQPVIADPACGWSHRTPSARRPMLPLGFGSRPFKRERTADLELVPTACKIVEGRKDDRESFRLHSSRGHMQIPVLG